MFVFPSFILYIDSLDKDSFCFYSAFYSGSLLFSGYFLWGTCHTFPYLPFDCTLANFLLTFSKELSSYIRCIWGD